MNLILACERYFLKIFKVLDEATIHNDKYSWDIDFYVVFKLLVIANHNDFKNKRLKIYLYF